MALVVVHAHVIDGTMRDVRTVLNAPGRIPCDHAESAPYNKQQRKLQ